jgi:TolB-like protein/DNA-binding winged helix-turn-helix (wHTH) protein
MSVDFRLGDAIVRPQRRLIERGDTSVTVKPKPMAVLQCLVAADGATVSRNELFDTVWPGGEVSDDTLTKCIVELRKAFGDTARDSRVIETIPKLGFRLATPVEPLEHDGGEETHTAGIQPSPREAKGVRGLAGLLSLAAILVLGVLLVFEAPRSWLLGVVNTSPPSPVDSSPTAAAQYPAGIAVLPFVNMSSDPENEFFSVGISEEILNALAATNTLPVIARTSSFQFTGGGADIKEIGRLLNVSHVLEGSVRKADGQVRVSAQVVDTATGMNIWADVYERTLTDILEVQADITRQVVGQITLALGGDLNLPPDVALARATSSTGELPASIEAYEQHLIGTQLLASYDPIPVERSLEYFDRAIALDPDYADAWAGRGRALLVRGLDRGGHRDMPVDVYPPAIAAFRRALEIEPRHAFAMGWLGEALILNDFQWAEGLRLMKQSLEINPNDAAIMARYGIWMEKMNLAGSQEILERAFRLDPLGFETVRVRANHLARAGRWLDAADVIDTLLVGNRDGYTANSYAAMFNLGALVKTSEEEQMRQARLEAAEVQIARARKVAHPVDYSLDVLEMMAHSLRQQTPLPWEAILERARTERLGSLMSMALGTPSLDAELLAEAFDLAIEQRDQDVCGVLFQRKPPLLPEEDWLRMRDITGVNQFEAASSR